MKTLRVAGITEESLVDGPGIRVTLFVQGCVRSCPGCHNPEAQDPEGGVEMEVQEILQRLEKTRGVDGVTFSGGEPFLQPAALAEIGEELRRRNLHLVVYTGYTFEELLEMSSQHPSVKDLLQVTQILVDGPYQQEEREVEVPFRGSSNQRFIEVAPSLERGIPVSVARQDWGLTG